MFITDSTTTTLLGSRICLRPINEDDFAPLHALIIASPDTYFYSNIGHETAQFLRWFEQAVADGAYVVVDRASDRLVGSTRFYDFNPVVPRLTIGYTWYAADVLSSHVNPEAKLLLLTHAFEALKVERVGFEVDAQNTRSCRAVLRLGAVAEGVLRHHRRRQSDGHLSDTCCFSIVQSQWAAVKQNLLSRLALCA